MGVDGSRLGRSIRALRHRRGWRQEDLATQARTSQSAISRLELGACGGISVAALERVASALGGTLAVELRWQGERLDRLLDEQHARLVEEMVVLLRRVGWEVAPEVSFSIYGERGSIDILALHQATRSCLVVEVKSVVPDVQAMLAALDRKSRLAPRIARDRDWAVGSVSRLLVIRDTRTARRRVEAHERTFDAAFPTGGVDVRRWLRDPQAEAISGIWFLPGTRQAGTRQRLRGSSKGAPARPRSSGAVVSSPTAANGASHPSSG
jgi:transcriptional regulator with XRE-family HTH domain